MMRSMHMQNVKGWMLNHTEFKTIHIHFIGAINTWWFMIGKLLDCKTCHDEQLVNFNTHYKRKYMQHSLIIIGQLAQLIRASC